MLRCVVDRYVISIERPLPARIAQAGGGARAGEGVMARSSGKPATEVDFSDREQVRTWFRHQPHKLCIALAMRSTLRVLPLIDAASNNQNFASRVALPVFRACSVAWAIGNYPSWQDRLRSRA